MPAAASGHLAALPSVTIILAIRNPDRRYHALLRPRRRSAERGNEFSRLRCGLPCDHPMGGHACAGGLDHASIV